MAEYDNSNSVILFKAKNKTEDWHAEYEGTWTGENGDEFYATCKIKEGKNGKFLLVKRGKPKGEKKGPGQKPQSMYDDPLNDEIPF